MLAPRARPEKKDLGGKIKWDERWSNEKRAPPQKEDAKSAGPRPPLIKSDLLNLANEICPLSPGEGGLVIEAASVLRGFFHRAGTNAPARSAKRISAVAARLAKRCLGTASRGLVRLGGRGLFLLLF